MTRRPPFLTALKLAGFDQKRARQLAESCSAQERQQQRAREREDESRFRERMNDIRRRANILVGSTEGGEDYRMLLDDFASLPMWLTAASGAGKSRLLGGFVAQIVAAITRGAPLTLTLLDGKGETADQTMRTVAEAASQLPRSTRKTFLSKLYVLRFFDAAYLPSWPILAPMAGLTVLEQADLISEALVESSVDSTVGPRQKLMISRILALAIEFEIPFIAIPWLLNNPTEITRLASESSSPAVRLDLARFERESQNSIDGIVARIGLLLMPSLKAVLSGIHPFDFAKCHEPGAITIIDASAAGRARAAARSIGSLILPPWANAGFCRPWGSELKSVLMVDEPQAFLNSVSLSEFERLITLGRSFGIAGIIFAHQGATQLPVDFQTILNTNIPVRILGRSAERDASAASEWLPRTGTVRSGRLAENRERRGGQYLTEAQELRHHVVALGRLQQRHFLIADRRAGFSPRVIHAAAYDPPSWSDLDPEVAEAVRRGANGVPRVELEARVREIESEADRSFRSSKSAEPAKGRRRHRNLETPDVVTRSPKVGEGDES